MPKKTLHFYTPTHGVRDDFLALMNEFLQLKTVRFSEFSRIWRSKKMSFLCAGRFSDREAREFIEKTLMIALDFFLPPYQFQVRVGGLYLLYAIFETQPIKPRVKVRLTQAQWIKTMSFQQEAAQQNHLDVVFVFNKMLQDHAFHLCFTASEKSTRTNDHEVEKAESNLADDMTEDRRDIDTLFNYEAMEKLSYLLDHYQKMKVNLAGPEATVPDKSLDVVQGTMVEDLVTMLQSFKTSVGNIHKHGKPEGVASSHEKQEHPPESTGAKRRALKARAFSQVAVGNKRSTFVMSVDGLPCPEDSTQQSDDPPQSSTDSDTERGGFKVQPKYLKKEKRNRELIEATHSSDHVFGGRMAALPIGKSAKCHLDIDNLNVIRVEVYSKSKSPEPGAQKTLNSPDISEQLRSVGCVSAKDDQLASPASHQKNSLHVKFVDSEPGTSGQTDWSSEFMPFDIEKSYKHVLSPAKFVDSKGTRKNSNSKDDQCIHGHLVPLDKKGASQNTDSHKINLGAKHQVSKSNIYTSQSGSKSELYFTPCANGRGMKLNLRDEEETTVSHSTSAQPESKDKGEKSKNQEMKSSTIGKEKKSCSPSLSVKEYIIEEDDESPCKRRRMEARQQELRTINHLARKIAQRNPPDSKKQEMSVNSSLTENEISPQKSRQAKGAILSNKEMSTKSKKAGDMPYPKESKQKEVLPQDKRETSPKASTTKISSQKTTGSEDTETFNPNQPVGGSVGNTKRSRSPRSKNQNLSPPLENKKKSRLSGNKNHNSPLTSGNAKEKESPTENMKELPVVLANKTPSRGQAGKKRKYPTIPSGTVTEVVAYKEANKPTVFKPIAKCSNPSSSSSSSPATSSISVTAPKKYGKKTTMYVVQGNVSKPQENKEKYVSAKNVCGKKDTQSQVTACSSMPTNTKTRVSKQTSQSKQLSNRSDTGSSRRAKRSKQSP